MLRTQKNRHYDKRAVCPLVVGLQIPYHVFCRDKGNIAAQWQVLQVFFYHRNRNYFHACTSSVREVSITQVLPPSLMTSNPDWRRDEDSVFRAWILLAAGKRDSRNHTR